MSWARREVAALALITLAAAVPLGARAATRVRTEPARPRPAPLVDLNRAGEAELLALPGAGRALARRILDERGARGPFLSLDDVARRVNGVGPAMIERWRERAVAGE
jgi:competence protein ComEA